MKQYEITQHPIKLTLELDDEWLRSIDVEDSDMDGMANEWEKTTKQVALALHSIKAQKDMSDSMKGGLNE